MGTLMLYRADCKYECADEWQKPESLLLAVIKRSDILGTSDNKHLKITTEMPSKLVPKWLHSQHNQQSKG